VRSLREDAASAAAASSGELYADASQTATTEMVVSGIRVAPQQTKPAERVAAFALT
jgi:hypothetical protein